MTEDREKKPKIIVDEDWKGQVEAEKEALQQQADQQQAAAGGAEAEIPPASFSLLVTTLAAQAMAALGQAPNPAEDKPLARLDLARHYIDTLGILEAKTKGNLAPEESSLLARVLHELRMAFVTIPKPPEGASQSK
jgi:hypothetical protein